MINSQYMFRAPICSSSGGIVYTAFGIYGACYVGWRLTGWRIPTCQHWDYAKKVPLWGTEIILHVISRSVVTVTNQKENRERKMAAMIGQ
jgi:hypothetical protein